MKYKKTVTGTFISRVNRFIAKVSVDGKIENVHVKNTGRCKELFVPDAVVYLSVADNPSRKTKYDLIAVEKKIENKTVLINIDSQLPNDAAEEFIPLSGIFTGITKIRREVTYNNSRFDIYIEHGNQKSFVEVKGVTLEKDGIALFPDAPTQRGVKHIRELIRAKKEGYGAYILFVIQMTGIRKFSPNREMHPEFSEALKEAEKAGVEILAYDCEVTPDSMSIKNPVPVKLI